LCKCIYFVYYLMIVCQHKLRAIRCSDFSLFFENQIVHAVLDSDWVSMTKILTTFSQPLCFADFVLTESLF
jgi:hypothetical protein